jgi:glycosidase
MSTFIGNHDIARVIHSALDQPWGAWDNGDPWNAPPPLPDYAAPFERMAVAFGLLFTTKGIPLVYYGDEIGMAGAGDPDNRRFMQWEGLSQHQLKLRTHLEKLGAIRKDHPALWRGTRNTLSVSPDTYAYRMADAESGDEVFVALNRGDQNASVDGMPAKGRDEISGAQLTGPQLSVPPRTIYVVTPE